MSRTMCTVHMTKIGLPSRTKADNEKYCTLLICTATPVIGRFHLFAGLARLGNCTTCDLQTGYEGREPQCPDFDRQSRGNDKEYQTMVCAILHFDGEADETLGVGRASLLSGPVCLNRRYILPAGSLLRQQFSITSIP